MQKIPFPFVLLMVLVVGSTALAGCGSNGADEAATTTVPVTAAATVPVTTATTAPVTTTTTVPVTTATTAPVTTTTSPVVTVAKGRKIFGWLKSFEEGADGTITIRVDEAEMLTGNDAIAAARQDGVIGPGEELPNDVYIRNPEKSTVELAVSPRAVATLQACYEGGDCVTTEEVDLRTWAVLLGGENDAGLDWNWYGAGQLPYEFTIDNGVITAVHESYMP